MIYYRSSILLLLGIILLMNQAFTQTTPTYSISGTIISTVTGSPFSDGKVLVDKRTYPCDSAGNFSITDLPGGIYKLLFFSEYSTKDTLITLTDKDVFVNWSIDLGCRFYSKATALRDLEQGVAVLVTRPNFAPEADFTGKDFKKKYNVGYHIAGCVAPDRNECIKAYNETVFEYLDKKYGQKWREEVRKDVMAL